MPNDPPGKNPVPVAGVVTDDVDDDPNLNPLPPNFPLPKPLDPKAGVLPPVLAPKLEAQVNPPLWAAPLTPDDALPVFIPPTLVVDFEPIEALPKALLLVSFEGSTCLKAQVLPLMHPPGEGKKTQFDAAPFGSAAVGIMSSPFGPVIA